MEELVAVEVWEDLVQRGKASSLATDSLGHCLLAIDREPLIRLKGFQALLSPYD